MLLLVIVLTLSTTHGLGNCQQNFFTFVDFSGSIFLGELEYFVWVIMAMVPVFLQKKLEQKS